MYTSVEALCLKALTLRNADPTDSGARSDPPAVAAGGHRSLLPTLLKEKMKGGKAMHRLASHQMLLCRILFQCKMQSRACSGGCHSLSPKGSITEILGLSASHWE